MRGREPWTPVKQTGDVGDDGRDGRLHHGGEICPSDPRRMGRTGWKGWWGDDLLVHAPTYAV